MREVGGALLVHLPVQRVHHARHAGADGAVPVNVAAVPRAVHKAGIHRDCAICSGMAGVMDALYRSMNEECAAYLSHITITDIETQLFTQK